MCRGARQLACGGGVLCHHGDQLRRCDPGLVERIARLRELSAGAVEQVGCFREVTGTQGGKSLLGQVVAVPECGLRRLRCQSCPSNGDCRESYCHQQCAPSDASYGARAAGDGERDEAAAQHESDGGTPAEAPHPTGSEQTVDRDGGHQRSVYRKVVATDPDPAGTNEGECGRSADHRIVCHEVRPGGDDAEHPPGCAGTCPRHHESCCREQQHTAQEKRCRPSR
ncbi:unannotated protein [freshwater metagenome]|uniref:Unannotated protein n=1 Tax=freshwater metagenome TaxID=449393 RepID=A0A6J7ACT9_9ZZZZ